MSITRPIVGFAASGIAWAASNMTNLFPDVTSSMREDIHLGPAGEIELGARGQEVETGLRQSRAAFARQHDVELFLQFMQIGDVVRRISKLAFRQIRRAPIGGLLFLGKIDG